MLFSLPTRELGANAQDVSAESRNTHEVRNKNNFRDEFINLY
jgi:hemerythrin-like domain-containing protein